MTQTTTIKAGESAKTIMLPEGQSLTISGSAGALGTAYLLDAALGGMNSVKSWSIGTGALSSAIGPYANTQKIHITCMVGEISATMQDAVLTQPGGTGASVAAVLTGSGIVGQKITATLPDGVVGTLQFTKKLKASPFTKSNIANAVANAVNSLQYTVQPGDTIYDLSCDSSNTVSPSNTISATPVPSGDVAPAVLTNPVITGAPKEGQVATATAGTFSGNPTPTVVRDWKIDGVSKGPTYTYAAGDATRTAVVTESASNGVGSAAVATSDGVVIAAADIPVSVIAASAFAASAFDSYAL